MVKPTKATRREVAELAGVSTAVVSYVINNGPRPVAPHTKQRVLDVIEQLSYIPSASARALKLGATGTYGLLVPNVTNTFHGEVVERVDLNMSERGWSMLLGHSHSHPEREQQIIAEMINRGVDGMIVMMAATKDADWLRQTIPVPAVFLDRQSPLQGHITIGPDYEGGGRIATEHLISHGRQRIAAIHGPRFVGRDILRHTGYTTAMRAAGLQPLESVETQWSMSGGYNAGKRLLAGPSLPDGIFCCSDMIAVGVLHALQQAGVRVPDDVAVVCFDGTPAAEFAFPSLTSATQPVAAMTEAAVTALREPEPAGYDHRVFPVELVTRQSCGC